MNSFKTTQYFCFRNSKHSKKAHQFQPGSSRHKHFISDFQSLVKKTFYREYSFSRNTSISWTYRHTSVKFLVILTLISEEITRSCRCQPDAGRPLALSVKCFYCQDLLWCDGLTDLEICIHCEWIVNCHYFLRIYPYSLRLFYILNI